MDPHETDTPRRIPLWDCRKQRTAAKGISQDQATAGLPMQKPPMRLDPTAGDRVSSSADHPLGWFSAIPGIVVVELASQQLPRRAWRQSDDTMLEKKKTLLPERAKLSLPREIFLNPED